MGRKTPDEIIGADAVLALQFAGYKIVEAEPVQVGFDMGGDDFSVIWECYPHKVARKDAEKAFKKARRNGVSFQTLLDGVQRYVATKPHDKPWLNLSTFFNGSRWNDAPAPVVGRQSMGSSFLMAAARAKVTEDEEVRAFDASGSAVRRLPFG